MEDDDNSKLGWFLAGAVIGAASRSALCSQVGQGYTQVSGRQHKDGREAMEAGGRELMDRGKEIYERGKQIAEDAADLFERGRKLVQG